MGLAEIFVQLPPDIAEALIAGLERTNVSDVPSEGEVRLVTEQLIDAIRSEFPEDSEKMNDLLEQVPAAVVNELFA